MAQATIKRLYYAAMIFLPVLMLYLFFFWRAPVFTPAQDSWRICLLLCHGLLLLFIVPLFFAARRLKEQRSISSRGWLVIFSSLTVLMTAGVVIAVLDQLVTSSITPFLVACTFAALLFLISPLKLFLCYLIAYGLYYWTIGLTQPDSAMLLSNRINGITAVSIGMILAIILWTKTAETIRQERLIALQQEELTKKNLELELKNQELESIAAYDTLTGLYNRRQMQLLADQELRRAKRDGQPLSMLLADIDRFKTINDRYGHPVGDKLLIHLTGIFRARLRESDLASRWGGEEFLVLLPKAGLDHAMMIAEDLRKSVEAECLHVPPHRICCTISIGVSALDLSHEEPFMDAYREADRALYLAKEQGRNLVRMMHNSS